MGRKGLQMAWTPAPPIQAGEARGWRVAPVHHRPGPYLPAQHRPQWWPPFSGQQALGGKEVRGLWALCPHLRR